MNCAPKVTKWMRPSRRTVGCFVIIIDRAGIVRYAKAAMFCCMAAFTLTPARMVPTIAGLCLRA